jgi:hypothetical protein
MSRIPFSSLVDKIRNGNDNDIDNDDDDDNAMIGLTLILIVVVFLFALVAIRFLCNCFIIDIIVLSDYSTIRKFKEKLLFLLCCCRTTSSDNNNDDDDDDDTSNNSDDGNNNNNDDALEMMNTANSDTTMNGILMGLTSKQKRDIISSVLVSKMVTENDLNDWKLKSSGTSSTVTIPDGGPSVTDMKESTDTQENSSLTSLSSSSSPSSSSSSSSSSLQQTIASEDQEQEQGNSCDNDDNNNNDQEQEQEQEQEQLNGCCPICINDIKVEEQIYICHSHTTSKKHNNIDCHHHHFHLHCLVDWLSTGSTVCPYCRRVILTQDMVLEEMAATKTKEQQQPTEGSTIT